MSRPIYEPSLPRADAELGYGNRQLFRRPAPQGGEQISIFRADAQSVDPIIEDMNSGSGFVIPWTWWLNCNYSVFEEQSTIYVPDTLPVLGVDTVENVRLLVPGRYIFTVGVKIDPDCDGCNIALNEGGDPGYGYSEDHFSGPTAGYNTPGLITKTFSLTYPRKIDGSEWPDFSGSGFIDIFYTVAVVFASGGPRELDLAFLEITHDQPVDCELISS